MKIKNYLYQENNTMLIILFTIIVNIVLNVVSKDYFKTDPTMIAFLWNVLLGISIISMSIAEKRFYIYHIIGFFVMISGFIYIYILNGTLLK